MKTLTINLIRHGLTRSNITGAYTGREDISVSPRGIKELEFLKNKFNYQNPDAVIVSPLKRCKETADILYPGKVCVEIPGLTEYDFGEFEGKTAEELKSDKRYAEWIGSDGEGKAPFGESNSEFAQRVAAAFVQVVNGLISAQDINAISIITHGGVIMSILSMFGLPEAPMHEWICGPGTGYTLRADTSLWYKSAKLEVVDTFPESTEERAKKNKKYSCAIFDLDGTLLDTLEDLKNAVNVGLRCVGKPERTLEEVRCFVGNGVKNLVKRALGSNCEDEEFLKAFETFKSYYAEHSLDNTRPYDGITEVLDELKSKGVMIGVVSNKLDAVVKSLCKNFFPQVDFAIGEIAGIPRKPAPDAVGIAIDEMGADDSDTVYIGDSETDIYTARNAGIDCISATWGFRDISVLKEAGAEKFVNQPKEILRYMKKY